ncbi:hypothetical protein ACFO1B_15740 [Dactylosporangium siamense]|uniref:hypothetical protein n=1 Tax=Dactylosporangium siamense TaxID=685454 RepID=UPI0019447DA1|nr:hypothetical protein [Dactylosporangium siamense]
MYLRFQALTAPVQLRAVARLGDQDFFWDVIEPSLTDQLDATLSSVSVPSASTSLTTEVAKLLSLVRHPGVRSRMPVLEASYNKLGLPHRAAIAAAAPDPHFLPVTIEAMQTAGDWRVAEQLCELLVVPYGPLMSAEVLRAVLEGWSSNSKCRAASRMPKLAVVLYAATAHLGLARHPLWQQFVRDARARAEADDLPYYSYDGVEQAIVTDGGAPIGEFGARF